MISSKKLEIIVSFFFLITGLVFYWQGSSISATTTRWMNDAGIWPKWIGILIVLFSIVMFFQALRIQSTQIPILPKLESLMLIASLITYILLLPVLGFFIGSILWLMVLGFIAGERAIFKLLTRGVLITTFCYGVFWKILYVRLPAGLLDTFLGLEFILYR